MLRFSNEDRGYQTIRKLALSRPPPTCQAAQNFLAFTHIYH